MKATDVLMEEHRVIEQVLCCLEKLADRCATEQRLDGAAVLEVTDFLRHFADGCHHSKEEGHLFPMMEARGLPRQGGPTGVMRYEHEEGRRLIAALETAVRHDDAAGFTHAARAYVKLLREHIRKEDHCLFPMAKQALSPDDAESLWHAFEHVESHDMGTGTHERYLRLANDLADRLGVPRARVSTTCGHSCCHHH